MEIIVGDRIYKATLREWDGDNWTPDFLGDIEHTHTANMTEEEFEHFKKDYEYEVENAEHGDTGFLDKGKYNFECILLNGFEVDGKVFTSSKDFRVYQKKKELKKNIEEVISMLQEELKSIDEGYLMTHALDVEKKMVMICVENARLEGIV